MVSGVDLSEFCASPWLHEVCGMWYCGTWSAWCGEPCSMWYYGIWCDGRGGVGCNYVQGKIYQLLLLVKCGEEERFPAEVVGGPRCGEPAGPDR